MEFAFYKETGLLHDMQEEISVNTLDPATNRYYTQEHLDGLIVMDLDQFLKEREKRMDEEEEDQDGEEFRSRLKAYNDESLPL